MVVYTGHPSSGTKYQPKKVDPNAAKVDPNAAIDAALIGPKAKYHIETFGNDTYLSDGKNKVYFIVTGTGNNMTVTPETDLKKARDAYIKMLGGIGAAQKMLVDNGIIKKGTDYISGLNSLIQEYTLQSANDYMYNNKKTFSPFSSFITASKKGSSGSSASVDQSGTLAQESTALTSRGAANRTINQYFNDWLGIQATDTQKDMYYTELNKLETAAKNKYSTTKDANGNVISSSSESNKVTQDDLDNIAAKIIQPVILDMNADDLMKSGKKAAQNISALIIYSASMGIKTDANALMKVVGSTLTADGMTAAQARIKQNAITLYGKTLGSHIKAGGTVKDIVDVYANYKSNILELPQLDVLDPRDDKDIWAAISGDSLMSVGDFQRRVYEDPRYGKTKQAHETAADYTNTILKSFGFVA